MPEIRKPGAVAPNNDPFVEWTDGRHELDDLYDELAANIQPNGRTLLEEVERKTAFHEWERINRLRAQQSRGRARSVW